MESAIFLITYVSFLIPIVNTIVNPFYFQKVATLHAKEQGWNILIILTTRAGLYLTVYTQFWILIALIYMTPVTMFIGQSLSWIVFYLYHGINFINPMNLTYHPREFVEQVVSWKPPLKTPFRSTNLFNLIVWIGLHLQHTIFPFYLHYLTYKYNIDYSNNLYAVFYSFIVMGVYVIWHLFCWHVQGIPAYPFLTHLRQKNLEKLWYLVGFHFVIIVNTILASMWVELLFYCIGLFVMIMMILSL